MSWKIWPYWLKGGIIGLVSLGILYLLRPYLGPIFYDVVIITDFIPTNGGLTSRINTKLCFLFICLKIWQMVIAFPLVGALIGWLYGKFKEKRK